MFKTTMLAAAAILVLGSGAAMAESTTIRVVLKDLVTTNPPLFLKKYRRS